MMTPDDLLPRQRETVLLLWNGLAPKQVAGVMRISPRTVNAYISEVGGRLGGTCGPLQRIMLWQAELLNPTICGLKPPGAGPTLTVHAAPLMPEPRLP